MSEPVSLYIHIPFCVSKCRYCDFISYADKSRFIRRYTDGLKAEIADKAELYGTRPVRTLYIGGGTPSVLGADILADIMDEIHRGFDFTDDAEQSIEVNPESADKDKLISYRDMGINRLSIGLQSADDDELRTLGRAHTWADFLEAYGSAREAGFDNINIDIISAIPHQTTESHRKTLEKVISLNCEHISAYSLQLEEGTYFYRHRDDYAWVDEDTDREMYHMTANVLYGAGYYRYEISNYALRGRECRHNLIYWQGGDYIGIGVGAASYIDGARARNTDTLDGYLRGERIVESTPIDTRERMEEFMYLGLRVTEGISARRFEDEFDTPVTRVFGDVIDKCISEGLMSRDGDTYRLTELGLDVSNYVFARFLLD